MWELGKLLPIQADIDMVEGTLVGEVRDIGQFAGYLVLVVCAFRANPILHSVLLLVLCIVLEPDGYAFDIGNNLVLQGHVDLDVS